MLSPLDFGCTKTVYHGFSETGFYLKYKSYFLVRKHQILLENTWLLARTAIIYTGQGFVRQCPVPDVGPFKKNGIVYNFWSRDHKSGPIFMFDVVLDSGEQK